MRKAVGTKLKLLKIIVAAVIALVLFLGFLLLMIVSAVGQTFAATHSPSFGASSTANTDIPPALLKLYQDASTNCVGLEWQLVAGIGKVDSDHARLNGSTPDPLTGQVKPPIIGTPLDGVNDSRRTPDTDNGQYDGDSIWDREVGPFRFTPRSWIIYGVDGNGDGQADPHNIYDAVPAAVRRLCPTGTITDMRAALLDYNDSLQYVDEVLGFTDTYSEVGAVEINGEYATVGGITVAANLAPALEALLADAEADGIKFGGWGLRTNARQVELRKQNCGTSDYAIYQMPSSECSPPTARPGRSQHEIGLAVDFTENGKSLNSSSAGFRWLKVNGARYGFINLPSEPWHWSTTGR